MYLNQNTPELQYFMVLESEGSQGTPRQKASLNIVLFVLGFSCELQEYFMFDIYGIL